MRDDEQQQTVDDATSVMGRAFEPRASDPASSPDDIGDADLQALDSRTDGASQVKDAEHAG